MRRMDKSRAPFPNHWVLAIALLQCIFKAYQAVGNCERKSSHMRIPLIHQTLKLELL